MCEFDLAQFAGITCSMFLDATYELPPGWDDYGVPCTSFGLGYDDAAGELMCISDDPYGADSGGPYAVGTRVAHGGMQCTLLEAGIECTNEVGTRVVLTPDAYSLS